MNSLMKLLSVAAMVTLLLAGVLAEKAEKAAAAEPAVDGFSAKISGFGGGVNDQELGGLVGSLTFPLLPAFGVQIDGALASVDRNPFRAGALHLFWRDPAVGMLGVFASHSWLNTEGGVEVNRAALEWQGFFGPLTLDGALGYRFGDVREEAYGKLNLDYYLTDDWLVSAGFSYDNRGFGTFKTEYQIASGSHTGLSLFAQGMVHDSNDYNILGGFKLYFGRQNRSLIDRHRREDPDVDFFTDTRLAQSRGRQLKQERLRRQQQTQLPVCTVDGSGLVTSPANGACLCPSGTLRAGQVPDNPAVNYYYCDGGSGE